MPALWRLDAARPVCPHTVGEATCHRPMFSNFKGEYWTCRLHGNVMSWTEAGRRVQRWSGRMYYEDGELAA